MGQSPKGEDCNLNGIGIPLLNGPTEFGTSYPTPVQYTTDPKKRAKKGDLLFCVRGSTVGRMNWADREYAIGRGLASISPKYIGEEHYIKALVDYNLPHILNIATGSTFPNVSKDTLIQLDVLIAPREERINISKLFKSIDNKIELNNAINKNLEELAQALFKRWFVDFEFPNENGEPYKSSGGEFEESELGLIPKGWKVDLLPDWIDFLEGPGIRNWQYKEEGIKFLNIRCIKNQDLDLMTANKVSEEEANGKYKHFLLAEGDVVVSTSGTLGRSAIVRKEHLPLMLNTSIIRFRPKDGMSFSFMHQYLLSKEFVNELNTKASGSVQLNFGPKHLKTIKMLIPEKQLLGKFEYAVRPLIDQMCSLKTENNRLLILRDSLLPKLMSGEIRVPVEQELSTHESYLVAENRAAYQP
ncbi:hypothetical protein C812_00101 [Paenibacillus barengoltzii G22]|uniref:Type I restriction modification DNA specificity domain-containing protein n=2 Tax=Paenibacillus barengoltzii TaxID=343517 RepID=R9LT88_9BACL|nr:hypothetical protein C812_00101 [Paenibacillus barengoltzii G22]